MLLAVHIADGILTWPWWTGGLVLAVGLFLLGAWRLQEEEVPRVALLAAVFFVASLIHVKLPFTSVHLLLNGLVGVLLGIRAALVIPIGLTLQAFLLGHGGVLALGVNACVMTLPALAAGGLFRGGRAFLHGRTPALGSLLLACALVTLFLATVAGLALLGWLPGPEVTYGDLAPLKSLLLQPVILLGIVGCGLTGLWLHRRLRDADDFSLGFLLGVAGVLGTTVLTMVVLLAGGETVWPGGVWMMTLAHVPIAAVEGIVTGCAVRFLVRVKPELLGHASRVSVGDIVNSPAETPLPATVPTGPARG